MSQEPGAEFARAAEQLLGAPFKLRGRDPKRGIDCVGLVLCALKAIGRKPPQVPRYTLRNTDLNSLLPLLDEVGFCPVSGEAKPGDLALLAPSAAQFHLAIITSEMRLIHAHAGLRRVVCSPMMPDLAIDARWRLT